MLERKTFAITGYQFKAADSGPGEFSGYGATFGNVDEGGDVILKGAFSDAIPSFLERGFVPVGHDWMGLPIATIADAKEDDSGLFFKAAFHSTTAAQDARTVMMERMDRGKFVGLSIGFLPDYDSGIEYRDDGVRLIKKIKELAEISFVTVPMNRLAGVTTAKGGLGSDLPYADFADLVAGQVSQLAERTRERIDFRRKEGRVLSQSNRNRLASIGEAMRLAAKDLDSILSETDPNAGKSQTVDLLRYRARLHDIDLMLAETAD